MRTSQETGTRARAGLFWTAPSPGAFVEVFHWNYVVGSASASPASLWTNERPPSRATARPESPRSARRTRRPAKAGARRGRRAGATLPSTSSGASRRTRCARFSSRRRTGGAAGACWARVLGRRRRARAARRRVARGWPLRWLPACAFLSRDASAGRASAAASVVSGSPEPFAPPLGFVGLWGGLEMSL